MLASSAGGASSRHVQELLRRCGSVHRLNQIHAHLVVRGDEAVDAVASQILASYCALPAGGGVWYARQLFDGIANPDRFVYNNLIRAYGNSHCPQEALHLHRGMIRRGILPNEFTLPFLLKACARAQAWEHVMVTHAVVVKLGFVRQVFVGNALQHSYASAGSLGDSRQFFDEMMDRNVVSWNSMINGYAQAGNTREACSLFEAMRCQGLLADEFTLASLLFACSVEGNLEFGKLVHSHSLVSGCRIDLILSSALVDMYGKCGDLLMARTCFDMMPFKDAVSWTSMLCALAKHASVDAARDWFEQEPEKSIISWNAMISCYVQGGRFSEALDLYHRMNLLGLTPDEFTLAAVLSACGQHGDLVSGKMVHDYIRDNFHNPGVALSNSLLVMYARCGQVDTAISLFSEMPSKNVISWNAIIGALALHGRAQDALMFFRSMVSDAFPPDEITFVALLSACNHGGLLEAGQYYFQAMRHVYSVKPGVEHYTCMVDLLGRGGQLAKAVDLIKDMPMRPDVVVWGALLGACRIHGHIQIGKQVIKQLLELEGMSGGLFVLISNLLYETHQWEDMKRLRKLMREWGTKKNLGVSSIETNDNNLESGAEDIVHESSDDMYVAVDRLPHRLVFPNALAMLHCHQTN